MIELINFIELTYDEKLMVLEWRNHPDVKKWMYTTENIEKEAHLKFIVSLKNNKNKLYFVVKQKDKYLGVIDFTELNSQNIYFGLYANPDIKMVGVGRILEKISIDYAFDVLKKERLELEVFRSNRQVINLHKKFNFMEIETKIVNEKEVICMELVRENRKV